MSLVEYIRFRQSICVDFIYEISTYLQNFVFLNVDFIQLKT